MLACSIAAAANRAERSVAGLIALLLAVSAVELVSDSLVAAVSAGLVSALAVRLAVRGSCGWGSACMIDDGEELELSQNAPLVSGKELS